MAIAAETDLRQIGRTVEWNIKNFSNLHPGIGKEMLSPTFQIFNTVWQIKIYPEGKLPGKDYISYYMAKVRGKERILTKVTYSIKVNRYEIGTSEDEHTFKENVFWGSHAFVKRTEVLKHLSLNESLNDGSITVVFSVYIPDNIQKEVSTQTSNLDKGVKILTKNFEDFFLSQNLSDVNFKVGPKDYPAHKAVLAARSPVFSAMFEHEMKENMSGVVDVIDCDSDSFELFLKFLYTGNVDISTNNNCLGLYRIADKHGLDDLKEMCCDFMSESLEIDSVCDVLELAIRYEETELLKAAIEFFTVNSMDIFVTESWEKFNVEKSAMGNKILRQMAVNSKSKK